MSSDTRLNFMFSHSSQLSSTRSLRVYKFTTEVDIWFVNQSFFLVRYLVHKFSMIHSWIKLIWFSSSNHWLVHWFAVVLELTAHRGEQLFLNNVSPKAKV